MLRKRNALSKVEICRKSKLIQKRITNLTNFRFAKVIGAYFPVGSEVKTQHIISDALKNHKVLLLPKTEGDQIVFYQVLEEDFEKHKLNKSRFGIMEPSPSPAITENIDLLIVPGLAFDSNGYRLGYGKGYYDKFIEKNGCYLSVGLGFEFQLLNYDLPHSVFDQKLDAVATEKRMLVF
jgi:5-formyltetrahydrofolate cyclo-ligase